MNNHYLLKESLIIYLFIIFIIQIKKNGKKIK